MITYRNLDFHKVSLAIIDYDWMYGSGEQRAMRLAKKQFYENKINQARDNSSRMWKTLKALISTKNSNQINSIIHEGNEITEHLEDKFNSFFVDSINHIITESNFIFAN
nr:unnamed protein product [Callosobruchus analis]